MDFFEKLRVHAELEKKKVEDSMMMGNDEEMKDEDDAIDWNLDNDDDDTPYEIDYTVEYGNDFGKGLTSLEICERIDAAKKIIPFSEAMNIIKVR